MPIPGVGVTWPPANWKRGVSLNWVRDYTNDPFYQFVLRQYGITP